MMDRFPDAFILGAPKCGTTSMFRWLQEHPGTYLPVKEPGWFSPDLLEVRGLPGAISTETEYLDRLCPPDAVGRLTGEATPKYLYSSEALRALTPHRDRVRLIVMLRNPIDLAVAMHAQNLRQGREREPDFAKAWTRGSAEPNDRMTDYRFWGQPGAWLERWMAAWPRDRIHVLLLEEEMRQDPAKAYADVLNFLGLPPHCLENYAAENPRRSYRSARLQGASRRARRAGYGLMARLGLQPSGTGLLKVLDRLNGNRPGRATLPDALRRELADVLGDDAHRIARLLGRSRLPWSDFEWKRQTEHVEEQTI